MALAALSLLSLSFLAAGGRAEEPSSRPVNLWPLLYRQRTADRLEVDALFSLIAYRRAGSRTDLTIRPFYWKESDPERAYSRTDVLWPLAMRRREGRETRTRVLPLFFQKSEPSSSYSLLFPLYHHRRDASGRELGLFGLLPFTLLDFQRDASGENRSQRWVIWLWRRSPRRRSLSLPPLAAHESDDASGRRRTSALGLPDVFNLFERRVDPAESLLDWHALTVWVRRSPAESWTHAWPVYGRAERGGLVEHSMVWPFFRFASGPRAGELDWNAPWPLARRHRWEDASASRLFPLWARARDPGGAFGAPWLAAGMGLPLPIYYGSAGADRSYRRFLYIHWRAETPEYRRTVTVPWYSFENKQLGSRHLGLFPLYHASRRGGKALDAALPLFFSYREPGAAMSALPPLYWRYASAAATTTALVPLYLDRQAGDAHLRVLFPFYFHSREGARRDFTYYFPLYGSTSRDGKTTRHLLLFPLYSRLRDAESSSLDLLWPLFHLERSSSGSSARLLPLYWSSSAPAGGFSVGFPFYWSFASPASKQRYVLPLYGGFERPGKLRVDVFGPVYWRVERPERDYRREDILLSLYSSTREGDQRRTHLFPFYWSRSSSDHVTRTVPPLGGYAGDSDGERDLFFLGFTPALSLVRFQRLPGRESSERVLLYYRHRSKDASAMALAPLWFHWKDQEEAARVLFPLYAERTALADGAWRRAFLGVWGGFSVLEFSGDPKRDKASARFLFFYHDREGGERRTVLPPLYRSSSSPGEGRKQLFPLFAYRRQEADDERALGFVGFTPRWSLFSWMRDSTSSSSRFWPLYGHEREGKSLTFYALGVHPKLSVFSREADGDSSEGRVLFRFIRWRRAPGESAFELNPLFFATRKGETRYWAVLGGLFGVETSPGAPRRYTWLWLF